MDRFSIYLNNVINQLIGKNGIIINVIRKQGYPWFKFDDTIYFTEVKLRKIYTRFKYLFINKLYELLNKIRHDIDINVFKEINKFYYYY